MIRPRCRLLVSACASVEDAAEAEALWKPLCLRIMYLMKTVYIKFFNSSTPDPKFVKQGSLR